MAEKQQKIGGPSASPPPTSTTSSQAKFKVPLVCHGHSRPIVDLHYSPITPDGFFLISASKDGKPMLRNGETGDWIGTFEGHKGAVWSACLDRPALKAATGSADFSARVWDALSGEELKSFEHKHIVRTVQFSQSTTRLLTGGPEKLLRVFDLERTDAAPEVLEGMPGGIRCAMWHDHDRLIVSSCSDIPGVRVWDLRQGEVVHVLDESGTEGGGRSGGGGGRVGGEGAGTACTSLEITSESNHIVTANGSTVKVWNSSFEEQKLLKLPRKAESASYFSSTGRVAVGGEDMWVRVIDYNTGEELECHKGHHGPVHCVRFSPLGDACASGSEDGTIRIWHLLTDGAENGTSNIVHISADEVAKKVEGFHIAN